METQATTDKLAEDVYLAYVPHVTPEGEGVLVQWNEAIRQWTVDGSETVEHLCDARQRAMAMAAGRWTS